MVTSHLTLTLGQAAFRGNIYISKRCMIAIMVMSDLTSSDLEMLKPGYTTFKLCKIARWIWSSHTLTRMSYCGIDALVSVSSRHDLLSMLLPPLGPTLGCPIPSSFKCDLFFRRPSGNRRCMEKD